MATIETTDIMAEFARIYVIFDGEGDVPEDPSTGVVGVSTGGLILLSSRADHRPRIVIDTEPGSLADTPWADSTPLFQKVMHIPGPGIRIHDGYFSTDVKFSWHETGSKKVRVYRSGETVLNEIDDDGLLETVGVEQWLITLTNPRFS
jgi:hypothetical protein